MYNLRNSTKYDAHGLTASKDTEMSQNMRDKIVIVARKLSFCCKIVNTHLLFS